MISNLQSDIKKPRRYHPEYFSNKNILTLRITNSISNFASKLHRQMIVKAMKRVWIPPSFDSGYDNINI